MSWLDRFEAWAQRPAEILVRVLLVVVLVGMVWLVRDGCQRFNGARLGTGEYHLTIEGSLEGLSDASIPAQWTGKAALHRTSVWAGPDGYGIWLARPKWDAGLALSTKRRPTPGTYRIVHDDSATTEPPLGAFDGFLALTNDAATTFGSDSGMITIERRRGRLRGSFRVFVSDSSRWRPGPRRHLLVRGEFTL